MADAECDAQDFEHRFLTADDEDPFAVEATSFIGFRELLRDQPGWMRTEDFHWIVWQGQRMPFFYRTARISLHCREGYDVEVRNAGLAHARFPSEEVFMDRMNTEGAAQVADELAVNGGICDFPIISFHDDDQL